MALDSLCIFKGPGIRNEQNKRESWFGSWKQLLGTITIQIIPSSGFQVKHTVITPLQSVIYVPFLPYTSIQDTISKITTWVNLFTPLRGRVRPHQGHKVS